MEERIKGRVINIVSNIFYVETENEIIECTSRGIFKNKEIKPVVGDIVIINKDERTILEIGDRVSFIKRPKIANITQIILVVSCKKPKPDLLMLDKQLAFAEFINVKPIIVVNKIDLNEKIADEIEQVYNNIGYTVIKTNAKDMKGNNSIIKKCLEGNISAFSGNSGVGKSTLSNSLFNSSITEEGEISHKNQRGKNTTTCVKLYKLEDNTYIADTPGFSTFEIYEIPYKELYKYFIEIFKNSDKCEYMDCSHIKEENCNVKNSLEECKINKQRYENYIKIYEELKDKEEHKW